MTPAERLEFAFRFGHQWNPSYPNLQNIDEGRLALMDGSEGDAKSLIASWQGTDKNVETLVERMHGRELYLDGEVGPATEAVMQFKRCALPDFAPPPGARFHYDDPALQRAVETMQENAMGNGSWPSCDPDRPGVNSFRVRIDPARMPTTIAGYINNALAECVKAYAEMGCALRYILAATGDCEIQKRFESLGGSVIGWNEFPNPGTCNQTIDGRLDTGYAPSDWRLWANLECHETGHGVGLQHTRGHIMNPSILLVWPMSWRGGPSESTMERYFGGIPVPITGTPQPPPTDPTNPNPTGKRYEVRGVQQFWEIDGASEKLLHQTVSVPAAIA